MRLPQGAVVRKIKSLIRVPSRGRRDHPPAAAEMPLVAIIVFHGPTKEVEHEGLMVLKRDGPP